MKKRKLPELPKADFKNAPFRSLKGLEHSATLPAKRSTRQDVCKPADGNDDDDALLFLRAAEGARKLVQVPDDGLAQTTGKTPEKAMVRAPEDNQLFLAAMKKIGADFHENFLEQEQEEREQRSPTGRMRQLKRGAIRIGQELDLHGFQRDEALKQLERFVKGACISGHRAVLIITGKGINSPEGPVLQGAVAEWLTGNGKGLIAEFSSAPRELGGSGAFVVFLKKMCS